MPPIKSSCKAGSPSPRSLTRWRFDALRLCILLEDQGFLSGKDFNRLGINKQSWLQQKWIKRDGNIGRFARYIRGDSSDFPSDGFEEEIEQLRNKEFDNE